jgi:transcriptional regulator with XRE-family HTH domain
MPFHHEEIRKIRKALGISQFALAMKIDCTPQTVCNWERGKSVPRVDVLDRLHRFCEDNDLNPPDFWTPPSSKGRNRSRRKT